MYGIIIVSRGKGNKIKNKIKNLLTNKLFNSIIKEKREVLKMSYTVRFIIVAVALSVVVGGFMALCIVNTIAENGSPIVKWIMGIIIAVAIGCGISGLITLQNKGDDKAWNNGYCTECNEPYKFTSAIHHKNGGDEYYYTCDNCGHTIVIHGLRER